MVGRLQIDDVEFVLEDAKLMCFVDDDQGCLCWSIEVQCSVGVFAGERVRPRAQCDVVMRTFDKVGDWRQLFPLRVVVPEPAGAEADPAALLYVVEHMPMRDNVVEFGRVAGAECPIIWTGRGNVRLGADDEDVPVKIRAQATFLGAPVGRRSEDAGRSALAPYLDLDQFDFRLVHGVSTFVPK